MTNTPSSGLTVAGMQPPILQSLDCLAPPSANIRISVLRLDQMHPHLGGNKWFKLQANIKAIQAAGNPLVVSFGGAWSNHIRALAAAGRHFGFPTLGFIRGEIPQALNPVLRFARQCGMELRSLSRGDYRRKDDPEFLQHLCRGFGSHYLLPEGGSNALAVAGCEHIADYIKWQETTQRRIVLLPCGTGATLAGLVQGLSRQNSSNVEVWGVAVLKAPGYLHKQVDDFLAEVRGRQRESRVQVNWQIIEDYHCGGYARRSSELDAFLADAASWDLPLEPVYSGKLFLALREMLGKGIFTSPTEIIALHTGGIWPSASAQNPSN